jgi:hypothetical protein
LSFELSLRGEPPELRFRDDALKLFVIEENRKIENRPGRACYPQAVPDADVSFR